jgi:hypothetical protein
MKKHLLISILAIALMISSSLSIPAQTQSNQKTKGWGSLPRQESTALRAQTEAKEDGLVERGETAQQADASRPLLVGTWFIDVPGADGAPGFQAYQTFNEDGTFVETSSLLATLSEGPAHGVWSGKKRDFQLTFELFAFDPDHNPVGRIRVRCAIRIINDDNLTADTRVDFINPDGSVIPEIGSGPFTGKRVKVLPL